MATTIGKHYQGPLYNYTELCDYCGCFWHRHEMLLDSDGLIRCPDCMAGKTLTELADEAAAEVGYIEPVKGKTREGV
jgi:hypothetical protein